MAAELRAAALAALTVRKLANSRRGDDDDASGVGTSTPSVDASPDAAPRAAQATAPLAIALRLLISQAHTAVTTRPAFATAIGCSSYVRLEPLSRVDVVDFCARALGGVGSRSWRRLQARMTSSLALADALRTPVIMQASARRGTLTGA